MIEHMPVLFLLAVLSFIDIKKREVPHWGVLSLFIYSLFIVESYKASIFWSLYVFSGLFLIFLLTKGGMGGGDVKLLTVLAFCLGSMLPIYLGYLMVSAGIGFVASLVYFRRFNVSLPMVPFIFLAFLLYYLFGFLI